MSLSDDDFTLHFLFSVVIKAIPCYIGLVASLVRYLSIRNDGINLKTKYSRLTWSKLYLSYGMALVYLLPILFGLTVKNYWLKEHWSYSFGYLIYSLTWIILAVLTQMEHSRNLSNEFYGHKVFWILNLLGILGFSVVLVVKKYSKGDYADIVFMSIELTAAGVMIVMMAMTSPKQKKLIKERGETAAFEILGTRKPNVSFKEHPIQVYLDLSLNTDEFIGFKVQTEAFKLVIRRKFNEFLDIESFLFEYMQHTFPEGIQNVPIIDKAQIGSSTNISAAFEKRLKNLDKFLNGLARNKEFWGKEVLEFLGLENEEHQANFLTEHDKYIQVNKRSVISDSYLGSPDKREESKLSLSYKALLKQHTPKGQSQQPSQAQMQRRGTYYAEAPKIIEDYKMILSDEDNEFEPKRKMLKITVLDYKKAQEEIDYTIHIEYSKGKNWTVYKNFIEIANHRRRITKQFPNLKIPKITQAGSFDDQVFLERRKYEIQGYINYLLKSKQGYRELLEFISFYEYESETSERLVSDQLLGQRPSSPYNSSGRRANKGSSYHKVSLNGEESIDLLASARSTEEIFDNINREKHDDSDGEF